MSYAFPPDVEKLVQEQLARRGYDSEDDVLRDALNVFRELQSRKDRLLADVQVGLDQAERGLAGPLDVEALIDRCTLRLAEEGIRD